MWEALLAAFVTGMLVNTSRSFLFDDANGGNYIVFEAFGAFIWAVNCPSRSFVKQTFESIGNNMLSNFNRRHFVVEAEFTEVWNVALVKKTVNAKTPLEMGSTIIRILPDFDAMIFFVLLELCFLSLSSCSSIIFLALLLEHTDLKTLV